jgi:membrane protease YdiL (CAAX protease family)
MTTYQHPGSPPPRPELPEGIEVPPQPELPRLGIPAWSPLVVVVVMFASVLIATTATQIFAEVVGWDSERAVTSDEATIFLTLVLDASMVAGTLLVVGWLAGRRPRAADFGLRLVPWRRALGWTLAAYATYWFAGGIASLLLGTPEEQDIVVELKAEDSALIVAGIAVMVCLVAPLAEEFFFRGFLLRVLRERTNAAVAVIATGFAFGLVHLPSGDWRGMIILAMFGIALCGLFLLTSSLLPCIMLHAFHNSITFGFTKELPWWGILLLTVASVMTTFIIARLAIRLWPAPRVLQPSR